MEIGGTKGKLLTTNVKQIHADFMRAAEAFQGVQYDVLNVDAQEFHMDYYKFRSTIKELERRLGAVVLQVQIRERKSHTFYSMFAQIATELVALS